MKKKILMIIAIATLSVFALTACDGGQPEAVTVTPPPETQEATNSNDNDIAQTNDDPAPPEEDEPEPTFAFKYGDVLIEMDQDINYVLEKLGEPMGIFEAESCAFDGIDRIFGYPGMQIHTYPKGDSDFIHTISFRDDSDLMFTTEGSIRLNSDIQKVIDAYGDDYEFDTGLYRYRRGKTTLEFLTEDDKVTGITYGFILEF